MSSLRSFIKTLAIVAACSFIATPLVARAEDKPKAPRVEKVDKQKHGKGEFPMEATKFSEVVDAKIQLARAQMEMILTANSVPENVKAQVRKDFEAAAIKIKAATKEAGKDGKVTKEEAKDVRKESKSFIKDLREKYGKDGGKDKHAKRDGKHDGKRDGKHHGKRHGKKDA